MKKMKQFEDATLELVLFGFDVLTTSDNSAVSQEDFDQSALLNSGDTVNPWDQN